MSYDNVSKTADVAGGEFEVCATPLRMATAKARHELIIGLNAAYVYTTQRILMANVDRRTSMEGAAPLVGNADVTYRAVLPEAEFFLALVGGYFFDRIYTIGMWGYSDIVEKRRPQLDFVFSTKLWRCFSISLRARNLINPLVKLTRQFAGSEETCVGTKVENVYVLNSADDGIEFFGGCVNVTNLLVVNSDDDMFDFTLSYKGTLKNCYGRWEKGYTSTEKDPRGVEVDGNHDGEHQDDLEQSNLTIENMTIELLCDYVMQDAVKIRRGATVVVKNALVKGGKVDNCVDLSDKMGDAEKVTISYTLDGTTCTKDEVVQGGVPAEKATINNVKGNTGCPKNLFGWTGYKFQCLRRVAIKRAEGNFLPLSLLPL